MVATMGEGGGVQEMRRSNPRLFVPTQVKEKNARLFVLTHHRVEDLLITREMKVPTAPLRTHLREEKKESGI